MVKTSLLSLLIYLLSVARAKSWIDLRDYPLPVLDHRNRTLSRAESDKGPPWVPGKPCPRAIDYYQWNGNKDFCSSRRTGRGCRFNNLSTIHAALTHCPDIEELALRIDKCDGTSSNPCNLPFHSSSQDRYPNLRKLSVRGYRFGGPLAENAEEEFDEGWPSFLEEEEYDMAIWTGHVRASKSAAKEAREASIRAVEVNGETNLDLWLEAMDWGKLEELSIHFGGVTEADVISKMPERLQRLKVLEINDSAFIGGLKNNTLRSLQWVGRTKPGELANILAHQSKSLESLEYRCDELVCPTFPHPMNMLDLPRLAPRLQHLSINMPRNGSWPWENLLALTRLQSLQTADLYFRMQSDCHAYEATLKSTPGANLHSWYYGSRSEVRRCCQGRQRYQAPYLNRTSAAEMFSYLRGHKQGLELQSVTFLAGDWHPDYYFPSHAYMAKRRSRVRCSVEDGQELCKAENEKYWQGRFGTEYSYREEGGTWWGDKWQGKTWEDDVPPRRN